MRTIIEQEVSFDTHAQIQYLLQHELLPGTECQMTIMLNQQRTPILGTINKIHINNSTPPEMEIHISKAITLDTHKEIPKLGITPEEIFQLAMAI